MRARIGTKADARAALLRTLATRAEQLTEKRVFVPWASSSRGGRWVASRTPWSVIEAAAFVEARRWAGVREVGPEGGTPSWMLSVASAANLGMGERGQRRGAARRLADVLAVAGKIVEWRGGLRFEELAALLPGMGEERLWATLRWARRERVLLDLGERGWFVDHPEGVGPGSVAELRARVT